MSLFRKQTATPPVGTPTIAAPTQNVVESTPPVPQPTSPAFNGGDVHIAAVYQGARIGSDELDRVARAEGLLHLLPSQASQTREIVDATFRAFSVDRVAIVRAAEKQLDALESFIRASQEHTQRTLDASARRIAELEAEIDRCKQMAAQATHEGEQRARTVNDEMVKVQRVLDFFGAETISSDAVELDDDTGLGSAKPR